MNERLLNTLPLTICSPLFTPGHQKDSSPSKTKRNICFSRELSFVYLTKILSLRSNGRLLDNAQSPQIYIASKTDRREANLASIIQIHDYEDLLVPSNNHECQVYIEHVGHSCWKQSQSVLEAQRVSPFLQNPLTCPNRATHNWHLSEDISPLCSSLASFDPSSILFRRWARYWEAQGASDFDIVKQSHSFLASLFMASLRFGTVKWSSNGESMGQTTLRLQLRVPSTSVRPFSNEVFELIEPQTSFIATKKALFSVWVCPLMKGKTFLSLCAFVSSKGLRVESPRKSNFQDPKSSGFINRENDDEIQLVSLSQSASGEPIKLNSSQRWPKSKSRIHSRHYLHVRRHLIKIHPMKNILASSWALSFVRTQKRSDSVNGPFEERKARISSKEPFPILDYSNCNATDHPWALIVYSLWSQWAKCL